MEATSLPFAAVCAWFPGMPSRPCSTGYGVDCHDVDNGKTAQRYSHIAGGQPWGQLALPRKRIISNFIHLQPQLYYRRLHHHDSPWTSINVRGHPVRSRSAANRRPVCNFSRPRWLARVRWQPTVFGGNFGGNYPTSDASCPQAHHQTFVKLQAKPHVSGDAERTRGA